MEFSYSCLPEWTKTEWFICKKLRNFSSDDSVAHIAVLIPTHLESLLSFNFMTLFI